MAKRPRHYYLKSQITEGLYTTGKEWMLLDGTMYVGSYHKYFDGTVMTEASYSERRSEFLIPYKEISDTAGFVYDRITTAKDKVKAYSAPNHFIPKPTEDDIKQGFIIRYIIKRRNDPRAPLIEVNKADYKTLTQTNKGINGSLYYGIEIKWKISGPELDVKDSNGHIIQPGVRDTNERTVQRKEAQMPGLLSFLSELVELSPYQKISKLQ